MFSEDQLLDPQFDESAYMNYLLHTSSASGSSSAAEQARLQRCMDTVMSRIKLIFSEDSDFLVAEVKATYRAQQEVEDVCRSTESLTRATNRLRTMIEEPYLHVQQRVQELENTTEVAKALEAVQRLLSLCGRLQHYHHAPTAASDQPSTAAAEVGPTAAGAVARAAAPQELLRDARTLREIERLLSECAGTLDLREVDVVAAQMKTTEQASTAIRGRVREFLNIQDALERMHQHNSQSHRAGESFGDDTLTHTVQRVSLALQCAFILGSLPRTLQQFMAERKREVFKSIVRDLDQQRVVEEINTKLQTRLESDGVSSGGASRVSDAELNRLRLAVTQDVVLSRIQQVLFAAVQQSQCVLLLWSVLLEQDTLETTSATSPAHTTRLIDTVDAPPQLLMDYWQTVMDKMGEALNQLPRRTELQVALVSNYPRYHRVLDYFLSSYCLPVLPTLHDGPGTPHARSTRLAQLLLQHLPHCGMADVLLLLQVVESEGRHRASSAVSASPPAALASVVATVRRQSAAWGRSVMNALEQRFSQQVMEHHRQRLGVVLDALAAITPTSAAQASQVTDVCVRDLRHPSVPTTANALQVHQYTQLILGDVQAYRHDVHTTCLLLRCATRGLGQLGDKFNAAGAKWPLPPLPAITSAMTRSQLLHVCVANACTALCFDVTSALSLLPAVAVAATAPAAGTLTGSPIRAGSTAASPHLIEGADEEDTDDESALVSLRAQLWELVRLFRTTSESLAHPFLRSLRVTVGNAIGYCVDQATASAVLAKAAAPGARVLAPSVAQLRDQLTHFAAHFFFVFDPRTSEWASVCRDVSDTLLARLVAQTTTATPVLTSASVQPGTSTGLSAALRAGWGRCLNSTAEVLLESFQQMQNTTVGGGVRSRRTLLLRAALQQVCAIYAVTEWGTASACAALSGLLPSVTPLLGRLVLAQQAVVEAVAASGGQPSGAAAPTATFTATPLARRVELKDEALIDALEQLLLTAHDRDEPAPAREGGLSSETTSLLSLSVLDSALSASFDEATAYLSSTTTSPVVSTLKTLWAAVAAPTQ